MKKILFLAFVTLFLTTPFNSFGCVGRTLIIGSAGTPNDKLLTQLMAVLITERTGTTVKIKYFDQQGALYEALKKKEVNVLHENMKGAMQMLKMKMEGDADAIYSAVKKEYKDKLQLALLEPFGPSIAAGADKRFVDVPIVAAGILINFPVLPRVLNKLAGVMQDKHYPALLASVEAGDDPAKVAKAFLKKKKLI